MISDSAFAKLVSQDKPRIVANVHRHGAPWGSFGTQTYKWRCEGRGSRGYGDTPWRAWNRWQRNYAARLAHYTPAMEQRFLRIVK